MTTVIYCDHCGTSEELCAAPIGLTFYIAGGDADEELFDLCRDCRGELETWLAPRPEGATQSFKSGGA